MPMNIGPMEIVLVLVVALLVLGPKRLPAAGRSLGRSITEFKEGISSRPGREPAPTRELPVSPEPVAPPARQDDAAQETIGASD